MEFYDPIRPRDFAGRPLYLWQGKPVTSLPAISVSPLPSGQWRLSLWLLQASNEAVDFKVICRREEIEGILEAYQADPEGTVQGIFGWAGYSGHAKPALPASPSIGTSADF